MALRRLPDTSRASGTLREQEVEDDTASLLRLAMFDLLPEEKSEAIISVRNRS